MYSRQILAVLGSITVIFATAAFSFQARLPFSSSGDSSQSTLVADLVTNVESDLNELHKKVHSRVPASEKVEVLKQTLSGIDEVRKKNPLQTIDKEIYMDYSTESLNHVANDKNFSLEKCPEYKARVMNDFEPYAEKMPSHPALKRSFEIIEGICS